MYRLVPLAWLACYIVPAALIAGLYYEVWTWETLKSAAGIILITSGVVMLVAAHTWGCWNLYKFMEHAHKCDRCRDPDTSLGG